MVLIFGHRGAKGEAPENTLAGFAYARRLGVMGLELDVRLTADGELAVIHDATVDRTTDGSGVVAEFTMEGLAALDARGERGEHAGWPERLGVPRLAEVLEAQRDARLAIEIKTDDAERLERVGAALAAAIEAHGAGDRVTVTSFDPVALEIMRGLAPALPRAYIGAYDTPEFLKTAERLGCAQADVPLKRGSVEVVRAAQGLGMRVVGWLGNTEEDLAALLDWGVDGITTDSPTMALAYLRGRGVRSDEWAAGGLRPPRD